MRMSFGTISDLVGRPSGDREASNGQVLIMFALFLTVMLGVLGLATDLGVAFSQRRSMQNAADAGALAGALVVSKSTLIAPLSANANVDEVARKNGMSLGAIDSVTCTYINDSGSNLGGCGLIVLPGATGAQVTVTETHPTFFIRVLPGAPKSVTVSATARANVKKLDAPRDGPFLPCGINTQLASGGNLSLLLPTGPGGAWQINPLAVGQTFKIHGPQIEKCKAKASRYKGLADVDLNRGKTAPAWFNYKEGDATGLIAEDVEGPDGCKAGQEINNCVVFLPIAVDNPEEQGNNKQLWVVAFAPFYITAPRANEHYGKLLSDYIVSGRGKSGNWGWSPDYEGPIAVRLTG